MYAAPQSSVPDDAIGVISDVRGNIADVRLSRQIPVALFDVLRGEDGSEAGIELSVIARPSPTVVRCLLARPDQPPRLGQSVQATERMSRRDVPDAELASTVSNLNYRPARTAGVTETGIKAIDFLCPLGTGGTVGIFGGLGVGSSVLLGELRHRFTGKFAGFTFCPLIRRSDLESARSMRYQDAETLGEFDQHSDLLFAWLPTDSASDPILARETGLEIFDTVIYLSPLSTVRGLYPAVDAVCSTSKMLRPEIIGPEHHRVWTVYLQALNKV